MRILKKLLGIKENSNLKTMNPLQIKELIDSGEKIRLVDVREKWEFDTAHIKGCELMPLSEFKTHYGSLEKDEKIVVYCHHGSRSMTVSKFLVSQGYENVINMRGGIHLWAMTVDLQMKKY